MKAVRYNRTANSKRNLHEKNDLKKIHSAFRKKFEQKMLVTDIAPMIKKGLGVKVEGPILVTEIEDLSYPIKTDNIWKNWFMFAFKAFSEIAARAKLEGRTVKSFASIGTGPGVDAIGAIYRFESLKRVVVTDLDTELVKLAHYNVYNQSSPSLRFNAYCGNLCEPLKSRKIKFDIIYENLPNIPETDAIIEGVRASTLFNPELMASYQTNWPQNNQGLSQLLSAYMLSSHMAALLECRNCLKKGGSLILSIGGRVPFDLFEKMIKVAGYKFSELIAGFKIQTEPEDVLPCYAAAEDSQRVKFDFYPYQEAIQILTQKKIKYSYVHADGQELKSVLEPIKISAKEAQLLNTQGLKVGHTVHMLRALQE